MCLKYHCASVIPNETTIFEAQHTHKSCYTVNKICTGSFISLFYTVGFVWINCLPSSPVNPLNVWETEHEPEVLFLFFFFPNETRNDILTQMVMLCSRILSCLWVHWINPQLCSGVLISNWKRKSCEDIEWPGFSIRRLHVANAPVSFF